ncbi:hypothetical protein M378DRAFT_174095 [Amanita muscaria Koide BX008]|uniref:Uncharacterized protein n=1 Tax=Amanita muscaria (strain Koide BX008) TaxID=946122 RepID=A0A0C2RWR5_AMAMK|nr:hypothetical protein M378DRAFT_174095 [Amanita muscaria Koide BX008]
MATFGLRRSRCHIIYGYVLLSLSYLRGSSRDAVEVNETPKKLVSCSNYGIASNS